MPWPIAGLPPRARRTPEEGAKSSNRAVAIIRSIAFWRRGPASGRSRGALPALAVLGVVLPLLLALATQYSIQIVPDFDDYDWDDPDDDSRSEKKARAAWTAREPHSAGNARVAGLVWSVAILPSRASFQKRWDGHRSQVTSLPHSVPARFRGPPSLS